MTKYFVCSDIHGAELRLESALSAHPDIDTVIVCGDMEFEVYDIEEIIRRNTSRNMDIRMVRGNCDSWFSSASRIPDQLIIPLSSSSKALVLHGHLYHASIELMAYAAKEQGCNTVIFGHIHRQVDREQYGIRFLNPGAMKNRNYMTIETKEDGSLNVKMFE
ncbi:MAG: YfcE family phosphodiesterase [Clostridiales bacterium]|nr:YfcE family phosphodiesterase [Clostridiales bacterium]